VPKNLVLLVKDLRQRQLYHISYQANKRTLPATRWLQRPESTALFPTKTAREQLRRPRTTIMGDLGVTLSRLELVPQIADGENMLRLLRVALQLGPQPPDRGRDDAARLLAGVAPHMPDDLIGRADAAAALHQERKQVYLARSQIDGGVV